MKKLMNALAFIMIIGFTGAWEMGKCDFKTLLLNIGMTLTVLLTYHTLTFIIYLIKEIKKSKKRKLRRAKIY